MLLEREYPALAGPAVCDGGVVGTLGAGTLRAAQRVHALAILVVPLAGALAAMALAAREGVAARDLGLLLVLYLATMLGVSVGFHRHLAHGAFQAGPLMRTLLVVCGAMAAQGPPLYWVANHRRHHRWSDRPGDPHSPHARRDGPVSGWRGLLHAHAGWTFEHELTNPLVYCGDLLRDPRMLRLNRLYLAWVALGLLLPALAGGWAGGSLHAALTGLLWGGPVRLFLTYHFTASINSITHVFGRAAFETRDDSRNNAWLALPTVGEAWHNNHHAFPSSAAFGLAWWQLDPGALLVRLLARLGLVWNVRGPGRALLAARRLARKA